MDTRGKQARENKGLRGQIGLGPHLPEIWLSIPCTLLSLETQMWRNASIPLAVVTVLLCVESF